MKIRKFVVALIVAFAFPILAEAGDSVGVITKITVQNPSPSYGSNDGVVMFAAGPISGDPCTIKTEWAFSLSTEAGKAMHKLLLIAAEKKLPVTVSGTNRCSAWADREAPFYLFVNFP